MKKLPPRPPGLYLHIPFCLSRCGYCDFVSGVYDAGLVDSYLAAVGNEISARGVASAEFDTLFIGGGTPSCLSLRQLEKLGGLLPRIRGEATCEANPDSASREKLRLLRDIGVNRLSLGVQTFSETGLRWLGRRHTAGAAGRAIEAALAVGFPRGVGIDLINGWPGQDRGTLAEDLEIAVSYKPQHISNYSFILSPDARRAAEYARLPRLSDAEEREYWGVIEDRLERAGFCHYETSNFCRSGFMCRHNAAIWRGGEYLGLGLGAHSHLGGERFANRDDLAGYLRHSSSPGGLVKFRERLGRTAKARECAVFWLRLFEGIDLDEFAARAGVDFFELYREEAPALLSRGLLEATTSHVRVPRAHQPILDAIISELV